MMDDCLLLLLLLLFVVFVPVVATVADDLYFFGWGWGVSGVEMNVCGVGCLLWLF
jgi:hypothetical protein